jgi:hypothetical protein
MFFLSSKLYLTNEKLQPVAGFSIPGFAALRQAAWQPFSRSQDCDVAPGISSAVRGVATGCRATVLPFVTLRRVAGDQFSRS